MLKQMLTALLTTTVVSGLTSPLIAQMSPTEQMLASLGQRCNRATEVSYRSTRLRLPDQGTEVYVEGWTVRSFSPVKESG